MIKNLLATFLFFLPFLATAQQELGLHFSKNIWQSSFTNPAFTPDSKWMIALPSLYINANSSSISFSDLISTNVQGENVLDVTNLILNLEDRNQLRESVGLQTFAIAYKSDNWSLNFSNAIYQTAFIDYPKSLAQLVWEGNAQFIGQSVDLSNDLEIFAYNEFALGGTYNFSNITLGGRAKLLTGLGNISTSRGNLSLQTSDDIYQLTLQGDYIVNSSSYLNFNGFDDFDFQFNFDEFTANKLFTSNTGFAFDLGVSIDLDKLNIAASAVNIGSITWTEEVDNFAYQSTIEYGGLDIAQAYVEGDISIEEALDTLSEIFQPVETNNEYSTKVPERYYLSASYEVTDALTLGILGQAERFRENLYPALAVNAQYQVTKNFGLGATYAMIDDSFDNVGLSANIILGPVQVYAMADNIISAPKIVENNANIRVGVNLLFGKAERQIENRDYF